MKEIPSYMSPHAVMGAEMIDPDEVDVPEDLMDYLGSEGLEMVP